MSEIRILMWAVGAILSAQWAVVFYILRSRTARSNSIYTRIDELRKGTTAAAFALDTYKLSVAKEYASIEHLREVEDRLVGGIEKLNESMQELTATINKMIGAQMGGAK